MYARRLNMSLRPLPRQKPYCTVSDFAHFLRMMFCGKLIEGDSIQEFEAAFAKVYGAQHALAVSSCRSVFSLVLDGLDIVGGDEVVLPAFNFSAFSKILLYKGIKPVFVDIDENTLNIDANKIEQSITSKTKAIIAVHLFGNCCEIKKICSIAQKYHLWVIEDCANAFMTTYEGRLAGTFGDVACFSLSHSKDVPTFGGGILTTNNAELFKKILYYFEKDYRSPNMTNMVKMFLKNIFFKVMTASWVFSIFVYPIIYFFSLFGIDLIARLIEDKDAVIKGICKKRFTNFQAYIGLHKLKEGNTMQIKRIAFAEKLNQRLSDRKNIRWPKLIEGGSHVYWNYVLLVDSPLSFIKRLLSRGIDAKRMAAYDCNSYNIFKEYKRVCPVSKEIGVKALALPCYHYLKESDLAYLAETVKDIA